MGWGFVFISPHVGLWPNVHFPRSCTCCHKYYELICADALSCSEDTVYLQMCSTSGSYTLSVPSSTMLPDRDTDAVSYFVYLGQLYVSVLISIYSKQILVWWRSGDGLTIFYNDKPLVVSLILCAFSRITVVGSLWGRPWSVWPQSSWPS